ncbi:hypothetical protein [Nocardia jinanensis]|uniref:Uncharacterized protein n=1 Tax=Nocardia jinanensis TaxID=382504 RepID=A0A917RU46_9NOCA|nr:hypothetical protein [Nocardia jinanensis]GGL33225.1 hypothetical protein GCM10011588_55080 [Nocardia jinanensis]
MIGKFEANKDLIQELTSSGARRVGNIAGIITGTVSEVTREIGEWITDAIEMNEAAAAARRDAAESGGREDDPGVRDGAESRDVVTGSTAPVRESRVVLDADIVDAETADPGPSGKRY